MEILSVYSKLVRNEDFLVGMKLDRIHNDTSDPALYPISHIISHIFYQILELDTDHLDIDTYLIYERT